jgi:hypothetical protein
MASLHFRSEQAFSCSYSTAQNHPFTGVATSFQFRTSPGGRVRTWPVCPLENANLRGANPRPLDPSGAKAVASPLHPPVQGQGEPYLENPTPLEPYLLPRLEFFSLFPS